MVWKVLPKYLINSKMPNNNLKVLRRLGTWWRQFWLCWFCTFLIPRSPKKHSEPSDILIGNLQLNLYTTFSLSPKEIRIAPKRMYKLIWKFLTFLKYQKKNNKLGHQLMWKTNFGQKQAWAELGQTQVKLVLEVVDEV